MAEISLRNGMSVNSFRSAIFKGITNGTERNFCRSVVITNGTEKILLYVFLSVPLFKLTAAERYTQILNIQQ